MTKIGIAQIKVPENKDVVIHKVREFVKRAKSKKIDIILFPEYLSGLTFAKKNINILENLTNIAERENIYICCGCVEKEESNHFGNYGVLISNKGKLVLKHQKIYLAPPERNDKILPGKKISVVDTKFGRIGILLCKDTFNIYSHHLYMALRKLNVDILLVPTWSILWKEQSTIDYIRTSLLMGSYLTNAYVFVGGNTNKGSFGHSLIINPLDGITHEGSKAKEELLYSEVDLKKLEKVRTFEKWWQPSIKQHLKIT